MKQLKTGHKCSVLSNKKKQVLEEARFCEYSKRAKNADRPKTSAVSWNLARRHFIVGRYPKRSHHKNRLGLRQQKQLTQKDCPKSRF